MGQEVGGDDRLIIDTMTQQNREAAIAALERAGATVNRNGDDTSVEATIEQIAAAKMEMEAGA